MKKEYTKKDCKKEAKENRRKYYENLNAET